MTRKDCHIYDKICQTVEPRVISTLSASVTTTNTRLHERSPSTKPLLSNTYQTRIHRLHSPTRTFVSCLFAKSSPKTVAFDTTTFPSRHRMGWRNVFSTISWSAHQQSLITARIIKQTHEKFGKETYFPLQKIKLNAVTDSG